ncbi:MAG: LCP family protein [Lachnospiraceae bacterium]|nr:LCP family protein [Lachnospiraceae bacterium]
MSKEPETKKKKTSSSKATGSKTSGTRTSGKKTSSRKAKKRKKAKMITFAIEAVILVVLLAVLYVLNRTELLSKVTYDDEIVKESVNELSEETLETMEEYTNIALFGLDTRQAGSLGKGNRSDTIMVASINNKTKDVKIVSLYRDSYLNLANDKYRKCNEAYSIGGPEQAVAMLNMNLDLKIDYYMSVDFLAVSEVVDLLGGIEIDVDEYEIEHLNNYTVETSKVTGKSTNKLKSTGLQTLDGVQATSYCRIRYTAGDDFKRTERQREVLETIAAKAKTMSASQLDSIIKAVFPMCATNMSVDQLLAIAADGLSYNIVATSGFPFDVVTDSVGSAGSCVIPVDMEDNVKQLHEYLFDVKDYTPSETVAKISDKIKNDTGVY